MKILRLFMTAILGIALAAAILFGLATQTKAEVSNLPFKSQDYQAPENILATIWYVAEGGDDGNTCESWGDACETIAAAVDKAISGDTIEIAAGTYNEHDITVYKELTINGAGADSTIIDAAGNGRAFYAGSTILISNMRLQNGQTTAGPSFAGNGGAVFNSGTLTLQNVVMIDNNAVHGGGAVFNINAVTLNNVQVFSNTAATGGGGIYSINSGVISITESTIAHNSATGGASGGGGISSIGVSLLIQDLAIFDNNSNYLGGGLFIGVDDQAILENVTLADNEGATGAGFYVNQGTVTATNITVSGNTASNNYGGIHMTGTGVSLYLQNSTIANNTRTNTTGTGYNGIFMGGGASASMVNTILAYNQNRNCSSSSAPISLGHNLSSDYNCGLDQSGDLQGVDPLLGPLADNSGAVQTHALLPGSQAIDGGDDAQCPATDARGINRPYDGDGDSTAVCDIGAVETRHQLSISNNTIDEGDSGSVSAVFTVTLAPTSTMVVEVDYETVDVSAIGGSDYTPNSDTLTFNPGETEKYINIPVLGDTNDELDETFLVELSNPVNADLLDAQATGTIIDNDGLSTLSINDQTLLEGNTLTTPMVFSVTLSPPSPSVVSVDFALLEDTATAGNDYTDLSGELTFQPGETEQTISVDILGDVIDEGASEAFTVQLSDPVNATLADGEGIGTITDDETAQLRHELGPQVLEGDNGLTPATFTVTLNTPADFVITVDYEVSSGYGETGARAGEDFVAISGTLTFQPGDTVKTYTVQIIGDTDWETDESFSSLISNANVSIVPNTSSALILNDDDFSIYLPLLLR